jgi:hypothetical protein
LCSASHWVYALVRGSREKREREKKKERRKEGGEEAERKEEREQEGGRGQEGSDSVGLRGGQCREGGGCQCALGMDGVIYRREARSKCDSLARKGGEGG